MILSLLLIACGGPDTTISKQEIDADNDGYEESVDCDDAHATVNPDAPELCDGVDNDCDGVTDEDATDAPTWYGDADGDTWGDPGAPTVACEAPAGRVANDDDCDDTDAAVHPEATETCGGADEDCDGLVDDDDPDVTGGAPWYLDADGDQWGAGAEVTACVAPADHVAAPGDCDDTRADVRPDATETCDPDDVDEDCDGLADDADDPVEGAVAWRRDVDGDGYAPDGAATLTACEAPEGYTTTGGDCDDADATISPAATEVCDADDVDEDCDGLADDADPSTDSATWTTAWADGDGDGFGDPGRAVSQCATPAGFVANDDDCDDADRVVNPDGTETCGGADEDCDGLVDDADADVTGGASWFVDGDGDGWGDATPTVACLAPAGAVSTTGDCDDRDRGVNPDATEVCDAGDKDEDCDGLADDADPGVTGATAWYRDADGDGFAPDGALSQDRCEAPTGYVADGGDCDDLDRRVNPDATEVCDAGDVDEDCDGLADDADPSTDSATWTTAWADGDGDGFGDPSRAVSQCATPAGFVANDDDCDDTDRVVSPAGTETCGGGDQDCDGLVDDADPSTTGEPLWFVDGDRDGFGGATSTAACVAPSGFVAVAGDCDDGVAAVNPGMSEVCDPADVDEDCDGLADDATAVGPSSWFADADADGHGGDVGVTACDPDAGWLASSDDCDDTRADVSPSDPEVCDPADVDEDCDGRADDADASVSGESSWYPDGDGDGWGGVVAVLACTAPASHVATAGDCDDTRSGVNPGATEVCDPADLDEDCDGLADDTSAVGVGTWYADADGDSFGDAGVTERACEASAGWVADATDCDDGADDAFPGGVEVCGDGVDQDCSGADEACPEPRLSGDYDPADDDDALIFGTSTGDEFGYAMVAGDFDGDGRGDLLVSALWGDGSASYVDRGTLYGWYGDLPTGAVRADASPDVFYYQTSTSYDGSWGAALDNLGDLDGDGAEEFASTLTLTSTRVYLGGRTGTASASSYAIESSNSHASRAGDFAGEGTAGWAVASESYSSYTGAVYVHTGVSQNGVTTLLGDTTGDYAGSDIAGGGDVNGDGIDDLWIGVALDDQWDSGDGSAALFLGPVTGTIHMSDHDGRVAGGTYFATLGEHLWMGGDVDGDGRDDLLVQAPGADDGADTNAGATYLLTELSGSSIQRVDTVATAVIYGTSYTSGDEGSAAIGDLDHDGHADVLLANTNDDEFAVNAGAAYLAYGPFSGTLRVATDMDARWSTGGGYEQFGSALAIVSDGDEARSIALSSIGEDGPTGSGQGVVWLWGAR